MSKADITVHGLGELKRALANVASETRKGAEAAVAEEVAAVRDDAVKFAPRHTGKLEAGIHAEPAGLSGTVRSTARHSQFVEHGTYKDPAQPFMQPAAVRSRRRLPERAAAIIRAFLGG